MAGAAARHRVSVFDRVFAQQLRAFDLLMPLLVLSLVLVFGLTPDRGRPVHGEHFLPGPDELFGIAMTLEAPLHIQRCNLISERHQIDPAVTRRTTNALVHVNAVIEVNKVGQVVDARPAYRLTGPPALANGFQVRAIRPDLRVAVHARPGRRNSRKCGLLNTRVTVAAIDPGVSDMMFVAELNRLLTRKEGLSVVGRPVEFQQQPKDYPDKKYRAVDREFGYVVSAATKNLAHGLPISGAESENNDTFSTYDNFSKSFDAGTRVILNHSGHERANRICEEVCGCLKLRPRVWLCILRRHSNPGLID